MSSSATIEAMHEVRCASVMRPEFPLFGGNQILLNVMRNLLRDVRKEMAAFKYGTEHPHLALSLVHLANMKPATRILEVGYECGASGLPLALYARTVGATYHGFDAEPAGGYAGAEVDKKISDLQKKYALTDCSRFQPDAFDVKHLHGEYDFVFLDHAKEAYGPHLNALLAGKHLADGAWVLFHDVDYYLVGTSTIDVFSAIEEWATRTGAGETHYLRRGYQGLICPNLALLVYNRKESK